MKALNSSMTVWLPMKRATIQNGVVRLQQENQLAHAIGHFLVFLFYQFSNTTLSSLSPISTSRTLQHYLLEVQDYLENSCDPELESPAERNTTD